MEQCGVQSQKPRLLGIDLNGMRQVRKDFFCLAILEPESNEQLQCVLIVRERFIRDQRAPGEVGTSRREGLLYSRDQRAGHQAI
jgi:hypothetical protein